MIKRPRIIGIGIATMDIYRHHCRMYPGGNEYNVVWHAKAQGADAAMMGVFADDNVGTILERTLLDAEIDTSHSHHEHGSSGYAVVDLIDGDRTFIDWNKHGVTDLYPFIFTEEELEYISTFDVASISKNARLTYEKIKKLAGTGIAVSFDFNDNWTGRDIVEISPFIQIGFFSCSHLNIEEVKNLLKKCVDLGCKIAVGTRGEDACLAYDGEDYYVKEIKKVKATDTMGAGDSFISSFLTNYFSVTTDEPCITENKIYAALECASEYAALTVVKNGALGIGYDVNPDRLSEVIHISE